MKVLCIDDAPDILEILDLCVRLRWPDTEVLTAEDGPRGLALCESESPDLVIVDVGMPEMDGFEVTRRIRLYSDVPIVVLTVRDEDRDIATGLEIGADDYITKPFNHLELLSRLNAVLRRVRYSAVVDEEELEFGKVRIDPNTRQVWVDSDLISLTPIEYSLLYHLGRNAGTIQRHEALLRKVWGEEMDTIGDRHLLNVHINKLRTKLGDDAKHPELIMTERGVGYRLMKSESRVSVSNR